MNALFVLVLVAGTPAAATSSGGPGFKMPKEAVTRARDLEKKSEAARTAGQFDAAVQPLLDAIEIWKKYRGPTAIEIYNDDVNAAADYRHAGKTPQAIALLEPAVAGLKTSTDPGAPDLLHQAQNNLATAYASGGHLAEARQSFDLLLGELKDSPPSELRAHANDSQANVLLQLNDAAAAEGAAKNALADWKVVAKPNNPEMVHAMATLGMIEIRLNKLNEARLLLEGAVVALGQSKSGPEDEGYVLVLLGQLDLRQNRIEAALADFQNAINRMQGQLAPDHPLLKQANQGLQITLQRKNPPKTKPKEPSKPGD